MARRAVADAGIAVRPGALNPPPDSICSTLRVGSFSFCSSRVSARSGTATPNSFASSASTLGASASAFFSVGVRGVTSS